MAPVRMFISKFNGVVLIDEDHPLAVQQRAKDAAKPAAASSPSPPVEQAPPVSAESSPAAPAGSGGSVVPPRSPRKRGR